MIIGAAYYPEHWDKDRWVKDAELMREMGINTVRMGEFGWSVMEKEEGIFDFSLYDEAIGILWEHGISTILGTPTATPPAYLCEKYPDIYMRDKYGHARGFGSRRHYCYNHREYRVASRKIVRAMAEHYKNDKRVIAWQIDNELGCEDEVRCYCEDCRHRFIQWLKEKYISLENVNKAWGSVFWSQIYTDWKQIILPEYTVADPYTGNSHNPGLLLDFAEFSSDSLINFAQEQCEILRTLTDRPIVHNVVSEYCDNYKLAKLFDRVGYDAYPRSEWDDNSPGRIGFHYDLTRGYKKGETFFILEQQSGPCGWNVLGRTPEEGQLGLWSIQGAARGAEALIYFRWRTCLFGTEQFWYGILDHDGIPRKRYAELKETISGIKEYEAVFHLQEEKQVLLMYDYRNKFSFEFQPHARRFDYKEEVIHYYEALRKLHFNVDVGGLDSDFLHYKIVVFPFACIADKRVVEKLKVYVENGGILVLSAFTGRKEENNQMSENTLPGVFREMSGISIREFDSLGEDKEIVIWEEQKEEKRLCAPVYLWKEILEPEGAEILAYYEEKNNRKVERREAAITMNAFGSGKVYYIGGVFTDEKEVLEKIGDREQVWRPELPEEVECLIKKGGKYAILLNHSREEKEIFMEGFHPVKGENLRGWKESEKNGLVLKAYSSVVLEK